MAPSRPFWKGRRGPRGSFHHCRGKHIRSEFGSIAYRNRGMTPRTAAAATTTSSKIRSWIVVGALFPLWWGTGFDFASGITAGLMLGYIWYVGLHHLLHHWRIRPGSYLYHWKRRHALHHYARRPCNFGVTTQFWDRVFGTAHPGR